MYPLLVSTAPTRTHMTSTTDGQNLPPVDAARALEPADPWIAELGRIVEERWRTTGRPVLLSAVPGLLRNVGINIKAISGGRSLRAFIETAAGSHESFRLHRDPASPLIWGLVPSSAAVQSDQNLRLGMPPPNAESTGPVSRAHPAVWKAFNTPLADGFRRFISLDPIHYKDIKAGVNTEPEGMVEVRSPYLAEEGAHEAPHRVADRIGEWIAENGLDRDRFFVSRRRSTLSAANQTRLAVLLSLFKEDELSRVSIPLDVIARLEKAR